VKAAELVDRLAASRPRAVELAEMVSFAALVDRPLLRQARVRFVPEADSGVEADLWLSALVQSRSTDGITFIPEVASVLRERLSANPQRRNDAWSITSGERHESMAPTLVLEEQINHLSIDDSDEAARKIDELLASVLAAMSSGGREGLASWAARAMASFPTKVRRRDSAKMLAAGASLRLGVDPRQTLGGEMPEWLRFVAPPHLPVETVGVQLAPGVLRVDATKSPAGQLMRLPATRPYLIDVTWVSNEGLPEARQLALRAGDVQHLQVEGTEVQLRTVAGDTYELRLGGTAQADVRHHIIDFSEVLNRAGVAYEPADGLPNIDSSFESGITLFVGPPDSGKTGTLASLCRKWTREGTACVYHFFESGTPRLEYWEFAERSLIAQLMTWYDAPSWAVTMQLPDFLQMIAPAGTGPIYIVMDNIDVVKKGPAVGGVLGPLMPLPPQFVIVASATKSEQLRVNTGIVRVIELEPTRRRSLPLPSMHSSARRYIEALAVTRAPLPLEDADRLRASVDLSTLDVDPWTVQRPHLGKPSVTIVNESARTAILEEITDDDRKRAHEQLLRAITTAAGVEPTWYAVRHAAWHALQAEVGETATPMLTSPGWLKQSIQMFGPDITADIIDEIRHATVRNHSA
jgi:hypothetical protein